MAVAWKFWLVKQAFRPQSRRCLRTRPLGERLEPRNLLAIAQSLDDSSGAFLAAQHDDQKIVTPSAVTVPSAMRATSSGDYRIEALNSTYKWGTPSLTYSFFAGGGYYGSESSPTPVSDAVKANVRFILSEVFAPAINMTFTEVTDTPSNYGALRFLCTNSASYAYAYLPTAGDTNTGGSIDVVGDVCLNPSNDVVGTEFNSRNNSFRSGPGSHGFTALIHEIGHALGLKHSFESPSALPSAEENQDNTVMTYTFKGSEPATLMPYDLLALQYFYGANTNTRAGDTTYVFTTTDVFSPGGGSSGSPTATFSTMRNTLWDAGGTDALDLSALPAVNGGYRIDIRPGGWIAPTSSYNSVTYSGGTATNFGTRLPLTGTTIENIKTTSSSDSIFLNTAANVISGYKPASPNGTDVITGSNQADTLDLSQFFESSVAKSQAGNDLVLNLGGTAGTITVKDFFAVAAGSRINVVYKASTSDVAIAAASADKSEGNGGTATPFTFTVTRSGDLTGTSSVSWAVTGSGASQADATDFSGSVLPSGSVSFASGESSKTITVNVAADAAFESDEGFTVTLSAPIGTTLGNTTSATGTIRNDDLPPPSVSIAATSADKPEGTGSSSTPFTFTVTRSGDLSAASSVSWAVTGSGASQAEGADFSGSVLPSGSVSFAAAESSKTVTVNVAADATVESDEGFTVTLSAPIGASLGNTTSATGTIRNDDLPPPSITIAAASADKLEGTGGGPTPFTFTVTRSGDLQAASSVAWAVTGSGTSQADATDFSGGALPTGSVSFTAGESAKTITVNVSADATIESDEGFTVTLSSPSGATLGSPSAASGTIRSDDLPPPSVSIAAASAEKAEGTGLGTTPFTFTVTRSGDLRTASSVSWAATGSGASPADSGDFSGNVLPSGSVSFAANESTKTITVNVAADATIESDETFTVTLSAPSGATLGSPTVVVGTIRNDDFPPPPTLKIAVTSAEKPEGTGGGSTSFTFTVTRSGDLTVASSVSWAATGSGASPADGADFAGGVLPSGVISFTAGESTKTLTVNVAADSAIEPDEGFTVALSSPTGATLGSPSSAAGTIRNDDLPSLTIGNVQIVEGNSGTTAATLVVTLSAATFVPVTVTFATFDGSAKLSGGDYVASTGTLTFAPGELAKTIVVSAVGDTNFESEETFGVRLSQATGATIAKAEGLVTISNDDIRSRIAIAATDAVRSEGDTGRTAFTFTVTRTGSLIGDVMLPWRLTGSGSRPADRFDFVGGVLPVGTVWFAPGRPTATITVNVVGDRLAELDEQFTVTLSTPTNGLDFLAQGGGSATGKILNDDFGTVVRPLAPATTPVQTQAFASLGGGSTVAPAGASIGPQAFAVVGGSARRAPLAPLPRL